MKSFARLIVFTVIFFLGAQSALETCVHISTPLSTHLSSASHHSEKSNSQTTPHECFCSVICNATIKMVSEAAPLSAPVSGLVFHNLYPEIHFSLNQFHPQIIKPPIV